MSNVIKKRYSSLICALVIAMNLFSALGLDVLWAQTQKAAVASPAASLQESQKITAIYSKIQAANSLNTGLKLVVEESAGSDYTNDGKTLRVSRTLFDKLLAIDNGKGADLFVARETAYAENLKAGLTGFSLEYLSDKAGMIVCEKSDSKVSPMTFKKVVEAIGDDGLSKRDAIRSLKIGVSQYVSPADVARLMSNKMRRGVTIKKTINANEIGQIKGWNPILKNAVGGAVANVATYYGLNVASNMLEGMPIGESLKKSVKSTFTTEFLVGGIGGSVVGGTIGALIGSIIPVPGASPILGAFLATAPALLGANLGSEVGTNAILDYKKNKNISLKRVWDSMDMSYLIGHSVGMAAGMALGSALIPIPIVGGMIGGMIGGVVGSKIAQGLKMLVKGKKKDDSDKKKIISLPWLKQSAQDDQASGVSEPASVIPSSSAPASSDEIVKAQKEVSAAYQSYIKLLDSEKEGSASLQKALDDYKAASEKFKNLQSSASQTAQ